MKLEKEIMRIISEKNSWENKKFWSSSVYLRVKISIINKTTPGPDPYPNFADLWNKVDSVIMSKIKTGMYIFREMFAWLSESWIRIAIFSHWKPNGSLFSWQFHSKKKNSNIIWNDWEQFILFHTVLFSFYLLNCRRW